MGEWITIKALDGSGIFNAYLAKPTHSQPTACIIAIQEIFGVNEGMRQICDTLASQGYLALCPDLFWRQEPGVDITDKTQAEWDKAFSLFNGFDIDKGIEDIDASLQTARTLPNCNGKTASVGYCLGGKLAYLTACRTDSDANIAYYGVGIADMLSEAPNIKKPLLMHIAGQDEFVPVEQQIAMHTGLDHHPQITLYDYPEADHAFARPNGIHWRETDANTANERSADFFKTHLS